MDNVKYFDATSFNNIKEIIYNSAKKFSNNVAFKLKEKIDDETKYIDITYKEFLKKVNNLGTALFDLGYKGKRIAIIGRNKFEWALSHITNLLGGIVSVPLDKELHDIELEQSLARAKADAIIFDAKYQDKIEALKKNSDLNVKDYISMDKLDGYMDINSLVDTGEKLLKKGKKDFVDYNVDSDAMNILLFTSGTSAQSKAVMLSQRNIASNIYAMQLVEPIFPTDVNLAFLPFHHIFGSTGLLVMMACGVTTTFPEGIRYIAQNMNEFKVSLFIGVPVLIEAIYKNIKKEVKKQGKEFTLKMGIAISNFLLKFGIDIRKKLFKDIIDKLGGELRFIISGGAPLDKEISIFFNSIGIKTVQGYGLTETAPVLAAENDRCIRYGSVGKAMGNIDLEIVDKDENGIGELRAKGPNVMLGYYENEEQTNAVLKDGWFYTGDLGYIDSDGYVFLTGRKKDMIVLKNGKKVFPEEIEALINRLDIVSESMVFGLPKEDGDVKLSVKIVYDKEVAEKEYKDKSVEEIEGIIWGKIKEINKTLPNYKHIKDPVFFTDEPLIKTTTQKIKRNEEIKRIML